MTEDLKDDMRIIMQIFRPYWTFFADIAKNKKSSAQNKDFCWKLSKGSWVTPVKASLRAALAEHKTLRFMGISFLPDLDPDCLLSQRALCGRAAEFAIRTAGVRVGSCAAFSYSYPEAFAKLLDGPLADRKDAVRKFRADWHAVLEMEKAADNSDGVGDLVERFK